MRSKFVVNINKQMEKNNGAFNLNVEFNEKSKIIAKNPLTMRKVGAII